MLRKLYCIALVLIAVLTASSLKAQTEIKKHAVFLYPTRLVNRYFPVFSVGYLYQSESRWAAGANLGAVAEGGYLAGDRNMLIKKFESIRGYDLGLEARYLLKNMDTRIVRSRKTIAFYTALEASRAFANGRYGITAADANGVGQLVDTRLVARRNEFTLGLSNTWRFDFGLIVDIRIGLWVSGLSWGLTDKSLTPAPDATIFDEDTHGNGGVGQVANEVSWYPATRFRLGIGWQL